MKNVSSTKAPPFSSKYLSSTNTDYKPCLAAREENILSLRKRKLDDHLLKKRIKMLQDKSSHSSQYEVTSSSLNLSSDIINETYHTPKEFINAMITNLQSNSISKIKYALFQIRKMSIEREDLIEELYKANIVDYLLSIMNTNINDNYIIYESLWIMINITSKIMTKELTNSFLSESSYALYIRIFDKGINDIRDSLLWLLVNVSMGNEQAMSSLVYSSLIANHVIPYITTEKEIPKESLKMSINLLSSIVNGIKFSSSFPPSEKIKSTEEKITKILCDYIYTNDEEMANDCLYGVSSLSNSSNEKVFNIIYASGIIRRIVKKEAKISINNAENLIKLLGNFLSNMSNEVIDILFFKEIVIFLEDFITHSNNNKILHDAFWALSNICCFPSEQITIIINSSIVPIMISKIKDADHFVGHEALYCLANLITSNDINIAINISQYDIIEVLLKSIEKYYQNPQSIQLIVESLGTLFEIGERIKKQTNNQNVYINTCWNKGGKDLLEKLLNYQDNGVYKTVSNIIQNYFSY